MKEYHKIQSIYKRDEQTKRFIIGDYSEPVFEYLKNNKWIWTEKVDGTNVRIDWHYLSRTVEIGGRTDNAQMPIFLLNKLQQIFTVEKFSTLYPDTDMLLFGEGYGAKIQKGGGNYISEGVDFVLFDVCIGDIYLERHNVEDIAEKLGLKIVPIVGEGNLQEAIDFVKPGFTSQWGNFTAEGLVMRPQTELRSRNGKRVITKIKYKDFNF